jgi:hypothetical protein
LHPHLQQFRRLLINHLLIDLLHLADRVLEETGLDRAAVGLEAGLEAVAEADLVVEVVVVDSEAEVEEDHQVRQDRRGRWIFQEELDHQGHRGRLDHQGRLQLLILTVLLPHTERLYLRSM